MNVSIDHPTDRPNFSRVRINDIVIWFSYQTPIAFHHPSTGEVVRENDWGPTTGKHLNYIEARHDRRVSGEEFQRRFDAVMNAGDYRIEEQDLVA